MVSTQWVQQSKQQVLSVRQCGREFQVVLSLFSSVVSILVQVKAWKGIQRAWRKLTTYTDFLFTGKITLINTVIQLASRGCCTQQTGRSPEQDCLQKLKEIALRLDSTNLKSWEQLDPADARSNSDRLTCKQDWSQRISWASAQSTIKVGWLLSFHGASSGSDCRCEVSAPWVRRNKTLLARTGYEQESLGPFLLVVIISVILVVSPPHLAQMLCCKGGLGLSEPELAGLEVLYSVSGVVLEGGGPGRLAKDLQGIRQGSCCHARRSVAGAFQVE